MEGFVSILEELFRGSGKLGIGIIGLLFFLIIIVPIVKIWDWLKESSEQARIERTAAILQARERENKEALEQLFRIPSGAEELVMSAKVTPVEKFLELYTIDYFHRQNMELKIEESKKRILENPPENIEELKKKLDEQIKLEI